MARNFRNKSHAAPPIADLNVTNLIDLAFMLLIIFMVATPLIQQEQTLPVNLPVASKSPQAKVDPDDRFESITVRADGNYALGSRTLSMAELSIQLARFAAQPKPPVLRLRWDAKSTAQQFVPLMSELEKHKLTRIQWDTRIAE